MNPADKMRFIQNMSVAFMKHHGYQPSESHLRGFAELYIQIQNVG
ncbi:hypothetical protein [Enterovibrio norvegicus]|nr:hypothetical protein [Enterovibrio norvegicus]